MSAEPTRGAEPGAPIRYRGLHGVSLCRELCPMILAGGREDLSPPLSSVSIARARVRSALSGEPSGALATSWSPNTVVLLRSHVTLLQRALFLGLSNNPHITDLHLDISGCELRSAGAGVLQELFPRVACVGTLDISDNGLDGDMLVVLPAFSRHPSLKHLLLGKNFNVKGRLLDEILQKLVHLVQEEECGRRELRQHQAADAVLGRVRGWLEEGRQPSWTEVSAAGPEVKAYHAQWGNLELHDGRQQVVAQRDGGEGAAVVGGVQAQAVERVVGAEDQEVVQPHVTPLLRSEPWAQAHRGASCAGTAKHSCWQRPLSFWHGLKPTSCGGGLRRPRPVPSGAPALQSLSLADSRLRQRGMVLVNALGSNAGLRRVDLSGNALEDSGAKMLSKALQINTTL
ncbi:LOW QUALITY PROTEIN: hypothetical protein CRUP_002650, partial [Coryphaenoides rupestris]